MMLTSLGCFVQLEPPSPQYKVEWQYLFQILPPHPRASISTLYWGEGGPKVGVGSGVAPYTCCSTGRISSINRRSMSSFLVPWFSHQGKLLSVGWGAGWRWGDVGEGEGGACLLEASLFDASLLKGKSSKAASSRTRHGRTFKKPGFEGLLKRCHFLVTESHFLPLFRAPYGPPHEGLPKLSRGEVYIERRLKDT